MKALYQVRLVHRTTPNSVGHYKVKRTHIAYTLLISVRFTLQPTVLELRAILTYEAQ